MFSKSSVTWDFGKFNEMEGNLFLYEMFKGFDVADYCRPLTKSERDELVPVEIGE